MLTQITLSNLITIESLQLDLSKGTTVITGESGVGKSILIDAIELALGARVTSDVVRPHQEKADICLSFDLTHLPEAKQWLKNYDLQSETHECIIRRTIFRDGRSKSYINQMPTTLQPLRQLSDLLLNIHGQHEHQTLLRSDVQRSLLDSYASHEDMVSKIEHLFQSWNEIHKEITDLKSKESERASRVDYLSFQLNELEALELTQGEFELLDLEHKQLAHAEELLQNINLTLSSLSENQLSKGLHALENVQKVDPKIAAWVENFKTILIQLSELEDDLNRYVESVEIDPEKFQQTELRLSTLFNLARKHKIDPPELYHFQQKLSKELQDLTHSNDKISALTLKINKIKEDYTQLADQLSKSREKAAKKLEKQITPLIQSLSLPHGKFHIRLDPLDKNQLHSHGAEKIIFEIQTNPDQPLLPLAKIASGGELSRMSLAIHISTAKQQTIPVLIFDEIDVGVSGQTAAMIGKLLRQLGETFQILCVTHVPQVASLGHQHLNVQKTVKNGTTYTTIATLSAKEKVKEIARMLGGAEITPKTLAHAEEMLEGA